MAEPARSGCPINAAVEAFGDSWSLLVLRDVMFGNKRHFRELLAGSEEGIASNILADRLKRLVNGGLLTRGGRRARTAGRVQPDRGVHPAGPGLRSARRLGTAPPADHETAARPRRAALCGRPRAVGQFMAELRATHLGQPRARATRSSRHRTPRRRLHRRTVSRSR